MTSSSHRQNGETENVHPDRVQVAPSIERPSVLGDEIGSAEVVRVRVVELGERRHTERAAGGGVHVQRRRRLNGRTERRADAVPNVE